MISLRRGSIIVEKDVFFLFSLIDFGTVICCFIKKDYCVDSWLRAPYKAANHLQNSLIYKVFALTNIQL